MSREKPRTGYREDAHSAPFTPPPESATDRWFVTNGVVAVGPVAFGLLTRGIAHGRVALTSFVRHESWRVWRRLKEVENLSRTERSALVERLRAASAAPEVGAEPSHQSGETLRARPSFDSQAPSSLRPPAVDPVGVMASATNLKEALTLTVTTALTAAGADVALLLRAQPGNASREMFRVEYVCGSRSELLLNESVGRSEPASEAIRAGRSLIAAAHDGDAASNISGRLERALGQVNSVALVPIFILGEPFAALELGRVFGAFRARDIARVEDVAEALVARAVVDGWAE